MSKWGRRTVKQRKVWWIMEAAGDEWSGEDRTVWGQDENKTQTQEGDRSWQTACSAWMGKNVFLCEWLQPQLNWNKLKSSAVWAERQQLVESCLKTAGSTCSEELRLQHYPNIINIILYCDNLVIVNMKILNFYFSYNNNYKFCYVMYKRSGNLCTVTSDIFTLRFFFSTNKAFKVFQVQ